MSTFEVSEREGEGLLEVRFRMGEAPGLLWLPQGKEGPFPLVQIQHPGMSGKDDPIVSVPARAWAKAHGWACFGLDAPGHGERRAPDPLAALRDPEQAAAMAAQFAGEVHDAVTALAARYPVDVERLGYYGYSLGAMLGTRAVADDGRFRAAVLAAVGTGPLTGPAEGEGSRLAGLADMAVRVIAKAQDEIVPADATMAFYAGIPGEKDLVTLAGGHFAIGDDVTGAAEEWLAARL